MGIPHRKENGRKDPPLSLRRRQASGHLNSIYIPSGPQISSHRNTHVHYTDDNYEANPSPTHCPSPLWCRPSVSMNYGHWDSNVYNHLGPNFPLRGTDTRKHTRHEGYETGEFSSDSSTCSSTQRRRRSEAHISRFREGPGPSNSRSSITSAVREFPGRLQVERITPQIQISHNHPRLAVERSWSAHQYFAGNHKKQSGY